MTKIRSTCIYLVVFIALNSCSSDKGPKTPEPSILIIPENNELCSTGVSVTNSQSNVEFSWSESKNTNYYNLVIENLNTNSRKNIDLLYQTSKSVRLDKANSYSWYVISVNEEKLDDTVQSEVWQFYLRGDNESNSPPFPAKAVSPIPGLTVELINGKSVIEWSTSDVDNDSLSYSLYLDEIDGNQDPPNEYLNLSDSFLEVSLNSESIYYWKVITSDGVNSSISQIYSFKTK